MKPYSKTNPITEDVMATKKLKKKVQRKPAVRKVENPVVESAREIWLAGLGAFSVAQEEGSKVLERGSKLFDRLVKEGGKLEKKARKDVEGAFNDIRGEIESRVTGIRTEVETRVKGVRGEVESRVDDLRDDVEERLQPVIREGKSIEKKASQNWDRMETFFEERVSAVMARLGMPTRDDMDSLNRRVQALSRKVGEIEKTAPVAVAEAVKKAVAPKPAAKKAAAKKPAAKKAAPKKAAKKVAKKPVAKKAAPKKAAPKKAAPKKVAEKKTPVEVPAAVEKAVETPPKAA
jgi:poly(hydroxyalkanoate) granule-associated protein